MGLSLQLRFSCGVCTRCPHDSPAGCGVARRRHCNLLRSHEAGEDSWLGTSCSQLQRCCICHWLLHSLVKLTATEVLEDSADPLVLYRRLLQMCLEPLWMLWSPAGMTAADVLAAVQQAIEAPGLRPLAAALLPSTQLETGTVFELDGLAEACRCAASALWQVCAGQAKAAASDTAGQ